MGSTPICRGSGSSSMVEPENTVPALSRGFFYRCDRCRHAQTERQIRNADAMFGQLGRECTAVKGLDT